MTAPIRVVVCDDHPMVRKALTDLIASARDMQLIGVASGGQEAVEMVTSLRPDVVLMDISMPGMTGIDATRRIMDVAPRVRVVVLTSFLEHDLVTQAIDAGAIGYLLKEAEPDEVLESVRAASRDEAPLSPKAARIVLETRMGRGSAGGLTDRHREILELVAAGSTNKEIASRLGISEKTVKTHLSTIFNIIGVYDRTQAAVWAKRQGMI